MSYVDRDPRYAEQQRIDRERERTRDQRLRELVVEAVEVVKSFPSGWIGSDPCDRVIFEAEQLREERTAPAGTKLKKKIPIPPEIRWEVWERDDFTCQGCGARRDLSVDHIHPESKGGTLDLDNLQTLCRTCNSRKGSKVDS